jgi:hypothetical protein
MSNNAVSKLTSLVPVPAQPLAAEGDWSRVEAALNTPSPDDYKEVVARYGTGMFDDHICLLSPFATTEQFNMLTHSALCLGNFWGYRCDKIWKRNLLPLYPQPLGLLPFSTHIDGHTISWQFVPERVDWNIVVLDFYSVEFGITPYRSFAAWLVDVLTERTTLIPGEDKENTYKFPPPHYFRSIDVDGLIRVEDFPRSDT